MELIILNEPSPEVVRAALHGRAVQIRQDMLREMAQKQILIEEQAREKQSRKGKGK